LLLIFVQYLFKGYLFVKTSQEIEEDVEHIINDIDTLTDSETTTASGSIKLEIVGDTSHLFVDEDFQKREIILLHNGTSNDTIADNLMLPKKTQQSSSSQTTNCAYSPTNQLNNNVKLVNGSHLTKILSDSTPLECFLVLFFVPWCPYSTRLAPIYNALPKAFLNLEILALDVSKSVGYNTKFGTSAVPMLLLFQNKNVLAKFNYTEKNLTDFIEFVSLKTGFKGNKSIAIDEEDFLGPVPTLTQKHFDYYLYISWTFLIFVVIDLTIRKTKLKVFLIRRLRRLAIWIRGFDQPIRFQAIENGVHFHND